MGEIYDKLKAGLYYCIIGIVSFIALVFLPMVGSTVGIGLSLPTTTAGWIVWIATKMIIAILNVLIFHCFMLQGKLNVSKDERYLEARRILKLYKPDKNYIPLSPRQWQAQQYGIKGVTIFITSALSVTALTQAVLTFDWISMLTYLFVIVMGLIFGILQMKKAETFWTDEYLEYALYIRNETTNLNKETITDDSLREQRISQSSGTSLGEQGTNSETLGD